MYKYPFAVKWLIEENRLKELKDNPGSFLESDLFEASKIPGLQYYLSLYPNGDHEERLGQTWIFLQLEFLDKVKIESEFSVVIESANFSFTENFVCEKTAGWGDMICATDELFDPENGYITDGKMIIKVEGILMVSKDIPKKAVTFEDHSVYLCLGLWNQDENKDFSIVADGKEITVHKCVLAVHSPVFARMFQSDLKEAQENKVIIEDFSFGIVEAAVKLCYHQSLITDITLDEKMKLIQFFDKYDIQSLKNDIESELISEIDETTVCQLANCSLLSNALNLKEKCAEFFQTCLNEKNHVTDLDILDEDFAYEMLQEAFFRISK